MCFLDMIVAWLSDYDFEYSCKLRNLKFFEIVGKYYKLKTISRPYISNIYKMKQAMKRYKTYQL